jgi:hypothetical protein
MAEGGEEGDGALGYPGTGRHQAPWFYNLKKIRPLPFKGEGRALSSIGGTTAQPVTVARDSPPWGGPAPGLVFPPLAAAMISRPFPEAPPGIKISVSQRGRQD